MGGTGTAKSRAATRVCFFDSDVEMGPLSPVWIVQFGELKYWCSFLDIFTPWSRVLAKTMRAQLQQQSAGWWWCNSNKEPCDRHRRPNDCKNDLLPMILYWNFHTHRCLLPRESTGSNYQSTTLFGLRWRYWSSKSWFDPTQCREWPKPSTPRVNSTARSPYGSVQYTSTDPYDVDRQ